MSARRDRRRRRWGRRSRSLIQNCETAARGGRAEVADGGGAQPKLSGEGGGVPRPTLVWQLTTHACIGVAAVPTYTLSSEAQAGLRAQAGRSGVRAGARAQHHPAPAHPARSCRSWRVVDASLRVAAPRPHQSNNTHSRHLRAAQHGVVRGLIVPHSRNGISGCVCSFLVPLLLLNSNAQHLARARPVIRPCIPCTRPRPSTNRPTTPSHPLSTSVKRRYSQRDLGGPSVVGTLECQKILGTARR